MVNQMKVLKSQLMEQRQIAHEIQLIMSKKTKTSRRQQSSFNAFSNSLAPLAEKPVENYALGQLQSLSSFTKSFDKAFWQFQTHPIGRRAGTLAQLTKAIIFSCMQWIWLQREEQRKVLINKLRGLCQLHLSEDKSSSINSQLSRLLKSVEILSRFQIMELWKTHLETHLQLINLFQQLVLKITKENPSQVQILEAAKNLFGVSVYLARNSGKSQASGEWDGKFGLMIIDQQIYIFYSLMLFDEQYRLKILGQEFLNFLNSSNQVKLTTSRTSIQRQSRKKVTQLNIMSSMIVENQPVKQQSIYDHSKLDQIIRQVKASQYVQVKPQKKKKEKPVQLGFSGFSNAPKEIPKQFNQLAVQATVSFVQTCCGFKFEQKQFCTQTEKVSVSQRGSGQRWPVSSNSSQTAQVSTAERGIGQKMKLIQKEIQTYLQSVDFSQFFTAPSLDFSILHRPQQLSLAIGPELISVDQQVMAVVSRMDKIIQTAKTVVKQQGISAKQQGGNQQVQTARKQYFTRETQSEGKSTKENCMLTEKNVIEIQQQTHQQLCDTSVCTKVSQLSESCTQTLTKAYQSASSQSNQVQLKHTYTLFQSNQVHTASQSAPKKFVSSCIQSEQIPAQIQISKIQMPRCFCCKEYFQGHLEDQFCPKCLENQVCEDCKKPQLVYVQQPIIFHSPPQPILDIPPPMNPLPPPKLKNRSAQPQPFLVPPRELQMPPSLIAHRHSQIRPPEQIRPIYDDMSHSPVIGMPQLRPPSPLIMRSHQTNRPPSPALLRPPSNRPPSPMLMRPDFRQMAMGPPGQNMILNGPNLPSSRMPLNPAIQFMKDDSGMMRGQTNRMLQSPSTLLLRPPVSAHFSNDSFNSRRSISPIRNLVQYNHPGIPPQMRQFHSNRIALAPSHSHKLLSPGRVVQRPGQPLELGVGQRQKSRSPINLRGEVVTRSYFERREWRGRNQR